MSGPYGHITVDPPNKQKKYQKLNTFSLYFTKYAWRFFPVDCTHRLNMELDLRSLFGLHVQCALCKAVLIGCEPAPPPPPPAFELIYEAAIGQPR
jgi:hypothetical protein